MTPRGTEARTPHFAWMRLVALVMGALLACSSDRSAPLDAPDASTYGRPALPRSGRWTSRSIWRATRPSSRSASR